MSFLSNSTWIAIVALALLSNPAGAQTFLCTPEVAGQWHFISRQFWRQISVSPTL